MIVIILVTCKNDLFVCRVEIQKERKIHNTWKPLLCFPSPWSKVQSSLKLSGLRVEHECKSYVMTINHRAYVFQLYSPKFIICHLMNMVPISTCEGLSLLRSNSTSLGVLVCRLLPSVESPGVGVGGGVPSKSSSKSFVDLSGRLSDFLAADKEIGKSSVRSAIVLSYPNSKSSRSCKN